MDRIEEIKKILTKYALAMNRSDYQKKAAIEINKLYTSLEIRAGWDECQIDLDAYYIRAKSSRIIKGKIVSRGRGRFVTDVPVPMDTINPMIGLCGSCSPPVSVCEGCTKITNARPLPL